MPRDSKLPSRRLWLGLLAAAPLLSACAEATEVPQTMFATQGDHSAAIYNLFFPVFYLAIAVFVVVEALLIYSVIRYRRRPGDGIPLQIHGNTPVEIAWTIIPALLVLFIAVLGFRTQAQIVRAATDPIRVKVTGHQWWWEFEYPDHKITTANELHIPADRDVELELTSADVIHSFWMPRLAGTTDAMAGHITRLIVKPLGAQQMLIRGQCKEFCGGTHAMMGFYVAVDDQATFDAWVRQQQADALQPEGVQAAASPGAAVGATVEATIAAESTPQAAIGDEVEATTIATIEATANAETTATPEQPLSAEAQGYQLFQSKGCIGCHVIKGYPNAVSRVGPDLSHVASRKHIVSGWLENTPENMQRWLLDPNEVKPDNVMGRVIKRGTLTDAEAQALTAYLMSLE